MEDEEFSKNNVRCEQQNSINDRITYQEFEDFLNSRRSLVPINLEFVNNSPKEYLRMYLINKKDFIHHLYFYSLFKDDEEFFKEIYSGQFKAEICLQMFPDGISKNLRKWILEQEYSGFEMSSKKYNPNREYLKNYDLAIVEKKLKKPRIFNFASGGSGWDQNYFCIAETLEEAKEIMMDNFKKGKFRTNDILDVILRIPKIQKITTGTFFIVNGGDYW